MVPLNVEMVKALSHELRVEILTILNERVASPNELAKELGEGLSQVSYHVKVLRDYGTITLVKTVPRRGAVEHYYRAKEQHMSRTALFLDDKGLKDVGRILEKARKQVLEVQLQSTARLAASEEKGMDAMVAMMGIEVPAVKGKGKAKARKG